MWKEEFDKLSREFRNDRECVKQFISSLLEKQKQEYEDRIMEIEKIHQEEIIKFLDALKKQKQEFINGERCLGCGKKTDTALADWCGDCFETM